MSKDNVGRSDPGFPSISKMRESQEKGNEGVGLNEKSYNQDCADFNQGVSINGEEDTEASSDIKGSPLPWMP
jgi:hypothetical protein